MEIPARFAGAVIKQMGKAPLSVEEQERRRTSATMVEARRLLDGSKYKEMAEAKRARKNARNSVLAQRGAFK
jgi:hypothetical protein